MQSSSHFTNYVADAFGASFEVHHVDLAIVSGLRRTILSDIPVAGFEGEENPSFEIIKNTGPLHNEIMQHRLGLIPIHLNEEETEAFTSDEYVVELNASNPASGIKNVTTQDFKVIKNGRELAPRDMQRIFPPHAVSKEFVLITRLRAGEEFAARGKPILSTGRHHAGFSAAFCTQSYIEDPVQAAHATNVLDKERSYMRNEYGDPIAFKFTVEPFGALSTRYLVSKAFEILRSKLQKTLTELYQEPSEYVSIKPWLQDNIVGYEFTFQGEDDTLGNLLQSLMYNHYIRAGKQSEHGRKVTYVGYICPHPLEQTMLLRVAMEGSPMLSEFVELLAETCRRVSAELQSLDTEWTHFNNMLSRRK